MQVKLRIERNVIWPGKLNKGSKYEALYAEIRSLQEGETLSVTCETTQEMGAVRASLNNTKLRVGFGFNLEVTRRLREDGEGGALYVRRAAEGAEDAE